MQFYYNIYHVYLGKLAPWPNYLFHKNIVIKMILSWFIFETYKKYMILWLLTKVCKKKKKITALLHQAKGLNVFLESEMT